MQTVPVFDSRGQKTPYQLVLTPMGTDVRVQLDENYAGREVDEEISLEGLSKLANGEMVKNFEALGFTLEGHGDEIEGIVSVGSGYDRFRIKAADLKAALTAHV